MKLELFLATALIAPMLAGCVTEASLRAACSQLQSQYRPPTAQAESISALQQRNKIKAQYDVSCSAYGPIAPEKK